VKVVVNFDYGNFHDIPRLLDMISESPWSRCVSLAFNPVFRATGNRDYCGVYLPPTTECHLMWARLYEAAMARDLDVSPLRLLQKGPCSFHRLGHIVVSPNGNVFECIGLPGFDRFATGTVLEDYDQRCLIRRRSWIERYTVRRQECDQCEYLPLCLGGCRFQALCDTGDLSGHVCHKELIEQCELPLVPAALTRPAERQPYADHL